MRVAPRSSSIDTTSGLTGADSETAPAASLPLIDCAVSSLKSDDRMRVLDADEPLGLRFNVETLGVIAMATGLVSVSVLTVVTGLSSVRVGSADFATVGSRVGVV